MKIQKKKDPPLFSLSHLTNENTPSPFLCSTQEEEEMDPALLVCPATHPLQLLISFPLSSLLQNPGTKTLFSYATAHSFPLSPLFQNPSTKTPFVMDSSNEMQQMSVIWWVDAVGISGYFFGGIRGGFFNHSLGHLWLLGWGIFPQICYCD